MSKTTVTSTIIDPAPVTSPARRVRRDGVPRKSPRRGRHAVSYVLAFVLMLFYLLPLAFLVNTALKSNAEFSRSPIGLVSEPRLANFVDAWQQGAFAGLTLNSLLYTVAAAGIGTFVGLVMAFPVSRGYIRGSKWFTALFVVVLFLPNAIITQFQLLLRLDLYNTQLGYILIMAAGVGVGPLLMNGYIKSVPTELDEAAALDGIGYWRYLFTFVVPLVKPALATTFLLQAIWVWNEIILATVLLPDQTKAPLTLGLLNFQGTYSNQWGLLAAATLIVATPLIVAYIFLQRFLVAGVIGGAVKG